MNKYPLVVIAGPTAAGKTNISLKIARRINGEIISADSMQIYRGMDIGTAKVSRRERALVKHHMIDIINPDHKFSVADFQERVERLIPEIINRGNLPLMVGGTGLYIKAVVEGFLFPEMKKDPDLRKKLQKKAESYGREHVHNMLKEIDPVSADKIHPNDLRRTIRAIEVYRQTGQTMSYFKRVQEEKPDRYYTLMFGLTREREELYERINKRVDLMLEEGLIEEVKELLNKGYDISSTALQGLGYKEIISYIKGEYGLQEAVRILKRDTRHFAKRQISWFKRDSDIIWFNLSRKKQENIINKIVTLIKEKFS
ncbi:MAG: tRNA (adenosine(37)-N6)-dimethylallyltransferase MiaA [Halanaerobiaceae bacterium]